MPDDEWEWPMAPDYGANLPRMTTPAILAGIEDTIRERLLRDPRIASVDKVLVRLDNDTIRLSVTVTEHRWRRIARSDLDLDIDQDGSDLDLDIDQDGNPSIIKPTAAELAEYIRDRLLEGAQ